MLAASILSCLSCLFGPPISGPPVERDTPPSIPLVGIDPPNGEIITIDREENPLRRFQVSGVTDQNVDDVIRYEFFVVDDDDVRSVKRGTLSLDESESDDALAVFGAVDYSLDACSEDVRNLDHVSVLLRLTDDIPLDQVERERATVHVVTLTWDVQLTGATCPLGEAF